MANEQAWISAVRELLQLLQGTSINELELNVAGTQILIKRQGASQRLTVKPLPADGSAAPLAPLVQEDRTLPITAPVAGVFYLAPSPGALPFVEVGSQVSTGQTVGLVEAMKILNEIKSEVSGRVKAICVENLQVVQKGDVLFRVEA